MAVSKRVRFEVFKRDLFTCQYCGRKPPEVMLEADHIVPKCEGGEDGMSNLTTACGTCNRGKGGKGLGKVLPALDEMSVLQGLQEIMERRQNIKSGIAAENAQRASEDEAIEQVQAWWKERLPHYVYDLDPKSIRNFIRKELPVQEISNAVDSAARARERKNLKSHEVPPYFYAVCWRKIKERSQDAFEASEDFG